MVITNRHNLPSVLIRALEKNVYSSGGSDLTVSSMHEPPRVRLLKEAHRGEMSSDVSEQINALLGTAFHHIAELAAGPDDIVEKRYHTTISDWDISGQVDHYSRADAKIMDWKVLSVWGVTVGNAIEEYTKKLNVYSYILRVNKEPVEKLSIVVLFRDWSAREARHNKDYPQAQCIEYELNVWSITEQVKYIRGLVEKHQSAQIDWDKDRVLPNCSPEDRWAKPEKWAVYKGTNVRATKLFDREDEARAFISSTTQGMRLEHRPGEQTRCMYFCPAKAFCDVGKSLEMAAEQAY